MATATTVEPMAGTVVADKDDETFEVTPIDAEDEQALAAAALEEEPVAGIEDEDAEKAAVAAKAAVDAAAQAAAVETKVAADAQAKADAETAPPKAKPSAPAMTPIERREREKRKEYARKWQSALEEQERLQTRINELSQEPKGEAKLAPERLAAVKAQADKAEGLGAVAEIAVQESAKLIAERDKHWSAEFKEMQRINHINTTWLGAQIAHPDFIEALQKSGIGGAIAQRDDGSFQNPYLARRVYFSANPGEEAYQLAQGRLEHERSIKAEQEGTAMGTEDKKEVAVAEPKVAEAKAEEREVEAERRGAKQVTDKVVANASKPKGIAGLRSAGAVKTRWSKEELDALMRKQPGRYQELIGKYPDLERFHLS